MEVTDQLALQTRAAILSDKRRMVPTMNENITLQARGTTTRDYCENNLRDVYSEYSDLSNKARARLVNSIAFALNDEEAVFSTGQVTDSEKNMVEFAIFTNTRVIYFKGKPEDRQPALQIIPRRSLTELTVLSSDTVIDAGRLLNDEAEYLLTYANGTEFKLPMKPARTAMRDAINRSLPDFYRDLEA